MRRYLRLVPFTSVSGNPRQGVEFSAKRTFFEHSRVCADASHLGGALPLPKAYVGADTLFGRTGWTPIFRSSVASFRSLDCWSNFLRGMPRLPSLHTNLAA